MTDKPPEGTEPPSEPEVDPEEVGSDLLRRLDFLDDRLQRSQEQMLSLLDRKLNDLQGPDWPGENTSNAPVPASPYSRWAPSPSAGPSGTSSGPVAQPVADPSSMDAWFSGSSSAPTASRSTTSQSLPGTAPGSTDQGSAASPPVAAVSTIPQGLRPAWQSNAFTVLITALVVVAGLFLVGLF